MKTTVSTKGQVVLPGPVRRGLDIRVGDPLEVSVESGRVVLTPRKRRQPRPRITTDAVTGLPVLTVGEESPELSSREVAEILSNFP